MARTFELGRDDDIAFCTMELVEGESLRDRLVRDGRLEAEQAIAIVRALCDGLAAAHAADVIHRDIKPENVLIARDGRVVLADFGVAAATLSETGEISGTLAYMAPEQARGEPAAPETDVYAVGVVLYEMVSGMRAFHGATEEVINAKQTTPHLAIEGCSRELAAIIARATARERTERIASASELGNLLSALAQEQPGAPPLEAVAGYVVRTVIVLPPRAAADTGHLAMALHEAVLARLGRLPRMRVLPRASPTAEAADCVVELALDDLVTATITRPSRAAVVVQLPLEVGELAVAADAILSRRLQLRSCLHRLGSAPRPRRRSIYYGARASGSNAGSVRPPRRSRCSNERTSYSPVIRGSSRRSRFVSSVPRSSSIRIPAIDLLARGCS